MTGGTLRPWIIRQSSRLQPNILAAQVWGRNLGLMTANLGVLIGRLQRHWNTFHACGDLGVFYGVH
jgi:hypothetical protein